MIEEEPFSMDIENPDKYFQDLVNDESLVSIIGLMAPPRYGAALFATSLEYGLFPPEDKEQNDLLRFHLNKFEGLLLYHMTFPKEYLEDAKALAFECDLKLVNSPINVGARMIIFCSKEKIEGSVQYPHFNIKTCYTLENLPGSKVYTSKASEVEALMKEEKRKVDDILSYKVKVVIPKIQ